MSNESNQNTDINIFASLKTKTADAPVELRTEVAKKLSTLDTKSKMIRFLAKEGYKTGQIANILSIRYQHVYNVLNTIHKS